MLHLAILPPTSYLNHTSNSCSHTTESASHSLHICIRNLSLNWENNFNNSPQCCNSYCSLNQKIVSLNHSSSIKFHLWSTTYFHKHSNPQSLRQLLEKKIVQQLSSPFAVLRETNPSFYFALKITQWMSGSSLYAGPLTEAGKTIVLATVWLGTLRPWK